MVSWALSQRGVMGMHAIAALCVLLCGHVVRGQQYTPFLGQNYDPGSEFIDSPVNNTNIFISTYIDR